MSTSAIDNYTAQQLRDLCKKLDAQGIPYPFDDFMRRIHAADVAEKVQGQVEEIMEAKEHGNRDQEV